AARPKSNGAVDVEKEELIELLIAEVGSEFEAVVADDFAEIIRDLESIAGLRQLSLEVVANGNPAINRDEWQAFLAGAQSRMNAKVRAGGQIRGVRGTRKADGREGASARIVDG